MELLQVAKDTSPIIVVMIVGYLVLRSLLTYFKELVDDTTTAWEKAINAISNNLAENTRAVRELHSIILEERVYADRRTAQAVQSVIAKLEK